MPVLSHSATVVASTPLGSTICADERNDRTMAGKRARMSIQTQPVFSLTSTGGRQLAAAGGNVDASALPNGARQVEFLGENLLKIPDGIAVRG